MPEDPTFKTVQEVAAMLKVSPMTVHRLIDAGEFPGTIRAGRGVRIPETSVHSFLSRGGSTKRGRGKVTRAPGGLSA
jgi:excisionase family DNA binding protein